MLPKYVTLLYTGSRYLVMSGAVLVHAEERAHWLFYWLAFHGYVSVAPNLYERSSHA